MGVYIAVPFCRSKCSFCNFASGPQPRAVFDRYIERLGDDFAVVAELASSRGCRFDASADSVYLGGGTPSILDPAQLKRIFDSMRQNFAITPGAEVTVECAPGTLTPQIVEVLAASGVTRVSLGVQSFIEKEARAVGRMHTPQIVAEELERLRAAGIAEVNIDLIAGLPYQTPESWGESLRRTVESGCGHVSVYMFEIDEDSRLGSEALRGGSRYSATHLPSEDETADLYLQAIDVLAAAGIEQYEISNFARRGHQARHNLKYWQREPYIGFGVDAHSMLPLAAEPHEALRWAQPDELDAYLSAGQLSFTTVTVHEALEETFFLGLRLLAGVDLAAIESVFGATVTAGYRTPIEKMITDGLLLREGSRISLTRKGLLLSNEVFVNFLGDEPPAGFD